MAKTLLNAVNETLKRVRLIQGDSGTLTSLTDSARQVYIDVAVQVWNEAIDELYEAGQKPHPLELAESTITLTNGNRAYQIATDVLQLRWPMLDETHGRFITEYPGGYMAIVQDQLFPANFTGLPLMGCIRPTDGYVYLDRIPQATEVGLVYKYRYDKDLVLTLATDQVPFNNAVFRALVPATAEMWKQAMNKQYDEDIHNKSIGRAAGYLTESIPKESWIPPRAPYKNLSDPYAD